MNIGGFGAIVAITATGEYGLLTTEHSASSYGLPVFVPLDSTYRQTGADARGSGEVGRLTSCGFVGRLGAPLETVGWTAEFRDSVFAAGFQFSSDWD